MTEQRTFVTTDEAFRNTQGLSWIFLCGGGALAYFVWLTSDWWSNLAYTALLGLAGVVTLYCGYTLLSLKQSDYFYSVTVDEQGLQLLDHKRQLTSLLWSSIAVVQQASTRRGIKLKELSGKMHYLPPTLENFDELLNLIAKQTLAFHRSITLPTTFMVDFRIPIFILLLISVFIIVSNHIGFFDISFLMVLAGLSPGVGEFLLSLRRPWRLEVTSAGIKIFRGVRGSYIAYHDIQSLFMSSQTVLGLGVAAKLSDGKTRLVSLLNHNPFLIYYAVRTGREQSGKIRDFS